MKTTLTLALALLASCTMEPHPYWTQNLQHRPTTIGPMPAQFYAPAISTYRYSQITGSFNNPYVNAW